MYGIVYDIVILNYVYKNTDMNVFIKTHIKAFLSYVLWCYSNSQGKKVSINEKNVMRQDNLVWVAKRELDNVGKIVKNTVLQQKH